MQEGGCKDFMRGSMNEKALVRVFKKGDTLEVGCRGAWNLWSQAKMSLTLKFEIGASNQKSCLWRSVNVVCEDSSRLNLGAGGEHLGEQLVHR